MVRDIEQQKHDQAQQRIQLLTQLLRRQGVLQRQKDELTNPQDTQTLSPTDKGEDPLSPAEKRRELERINAELEQISRQIGSLRAEGATTPTIAHNYERVMSSPDRLSIKGLGFQGVPSTGDAAGVGAGSGRIQYSWERAEKLKRQLKEAEQRLEEFEERAQWHSTRWDRRTHRTEQLHENLTNQVERISRRLSNLEDGLPETAGAVGRSVGMQFNAITIPNAAP